MRIALDPRTALPVDADAATLAGRAWVPGAPGGPSPVLIRPDVVVDLGASFATLAELMAEPDPATALREVGSAAPAIGATSAILSNSSADARDPQKPFFLAPCDLQAIKACGVTFAASLLERVIEEQARGDPAEGARRSGARCTRRDRRRPRRASSRARPRPRGSRGADRARAVVAVSRGRHRAGCGGLHQGAADVGGRHGCRGRHPSEIVVEQPGARGRARRERRRAHRGRDARATT